jgi:hypothetical protein
MIYSVAVLVFWLVLLLAAQRRTWHIALLGFPGVVLHELMHFLVGLILFAKPVSFSLIPQRSNNGWQFGSVSFKGLTLLNAAPVAYAPFLLIGVAWFSFHHWMLALFISQQYIAWIITGYLIACALFYSIPSSKDVKVGGLSTLFWLALLVAAWCLTQYIHLHFPS